MEGGLAGGERGQRGDVGEGEFGGGRYGGEGEEGEVQG